MTLPQSATPFKLLSKPSKDELLEEYLGQGLDGLRTPAFIIDRKVFADNCGRMHRQAKQWGAKFRAHLKTHKTIEGTKLQLVSEEDVTTAVVVSTMMEAWEVFEGGLVANGTIKDILYGVPLAPNKIADISDLRNQAKIHGCTVRLLLDHPNQVLHLEEFAKDRQGLERWSVFVKINGGQNRAGVGPKSPELFTLLDVLLKSPVISIYGFYGHAGNAYASTSLSEASRYLSGEVNSVNDAAEIALPLLQHSPYPHVHTQPFVLSVGSTPTAHAASAKTRDIIAQNLHGVLELHAGNYPLLDLQQQHTSLVEQGRIAQRVRATVISYYPGRGKNGTDEAMIDAGAIAFSKDGGPSGGYGDVINMPWKLVRISQEHGVLARTPDAPPEKEDLRVGTLVDIVGQHACLIAAAYPWYYVVDRDINNGTEIVDIWVPWKGW